MDYTFNLAQQQILLKVFNRKKFTDKLYNKIVTLDINVLNKKLSKCGFRLKIEFQDKD